MLFSELLIGVTNFFRDPEAWEQLKAEVLPALLGRRHSTSCCGPGYLPALPARKPIPLRSSLKRRWKKLKPAENITLQIFATDLDKHAIEKAREAVFPANIVCRCFGRAAGTLFCQMKRGYQVAKSIREWSSLPRKTSSWIHLLPNSTCISCRNLLIYLTPELQKKLMPLFHYSLNPGGFLFLGSAETIGEFTDLFAPLTGKIGSIPAARFCLS